MATATEDTSEAADTKKATSPQWTVKPDGEINIKVSLEIVASLLRTPLGPHYLSLIHVHCSLFIKDTIGPTLPVLNTCTV